MTMFLAGEEDSALAPLLLSIASLVVSVAAVAISLSQARLARRESERARPNVQLSAIFTDHLRIGPGVDQRAILVSVSNTGREDTELASLMITTDRIILNGANARLADGGPELPYRIAGHSHQTWMIDASHIEATAQSATITARFGHGEHRSLVVTKD